jgi:hypothetical protein
MSGPTGTGAIGNPQDPINALHRLCQWRGKCRSWLLALVFSGLDEIEAMQIFAREYPFAGSRSSSEQFCGCARKQACARLDREAGTFTYFVSHGMLLAAQT